MFLFSHCLCEGIINLTFAFDISLFCVEHVHYYYKIFFCYPNFSLFPNSVLLEYILGCKIEAEVEFF